VGAVYELDDQKKPEQFAGQKVTVTHPGTYPLGIELKVDHRALKSDLAAAVITAIALIIS
jgi:hypothetical protein